MGKVVSGNAVLNEDLHMQPPLINILVERGYYNMIIPRVGRPVKPEVGWSLAPQSPEPNGIDINIFEE
jgi:hypothetical protein